MTENDIIKGCIQKNATCQRILFEEYAGIMMSVCERYTSDESTAKDLLQEGFIRVYKYIHQYEGKGNFEGWMRKIFAHEAIRQLGKRKIEFVNSQGERDIADLSADVVAKISAAEIHQMIRRLPEGYRLVFNLHIIEGYSYEEIAKLLNIEQSTARSQLFKARKMLQAFIASHTKIMTV